jgi:hypothetical protein
MKIDGNLTGLIDLRLLEIAKCEWTIVSYCKLGRLVTSSQPVGAVGIDQPLLPLPGMNRIDSAAIIRAWQRSGCEM